VEEEERIRKSNRRKDFLEWKKDREADIEELGKR
jgi:hypothetical protein